MKEITFPSLKDQLKSVQVTYSSSTVKLRCLIFAYFETVSHEQLQEYEKDEIISDTMEKPCLIWIQSKDYYLNVI